MRFFLFFLLFFTLFQLPAQIRWKRDNSCQIISDQIFFLEDKKDSLPAAEICSGKYDHLFRKSGSKVLQFGFNESVYWLQFSIEQNASDSLLLELEHAFIPYAELFYQSNNGKWSSIRSGYKVNLKNKILKDHFQLFPLPTGNKKFYIKLIPYLHPIIIKVWRKDAYLLSANKQKIIYGIYIGILLFAIIINFFLFFALKKIYYLLYSVLVFLYIAASAGVMEGYMIFFFPGADMMYWYKIIPVLNMPALLLYCLFFLEIKKASLKLYRITLATCFFLILYIICLHFVPLSPFLMINQLLSIVVFILTICLGLVIGKRGNKLGYYFSLTYFIWFILLCFEEIYIQYGSPQHLFDLSYVSIAIFIEAFLLAFLLAKRFQWEKNEDEKTKSDMRQNIIEIKQRFELEIMQAQLEIQEETLQNISQEFHDNIGQTLSLIKINLNLLDNNLHSTHKERLLDSKELLSKAIQELRDLTKIINPDYIKDIGLTTAIEQQVKFIEKTGKYLVDFVVIGKIEAYALQKELLIFRIIQELMNNTLKHANASRINIRIQFTQEKLTIVFEDNGVGFEVDKVNQDKLKGLGLRTIINRVEILDGTIDIKSSAFTGTSILLIVPN